MDGVARFAMVARVSVALDLWMYVRTAVHETLFRELDRSRCFHNAGTELRNRFHCLDTRRMALSTVRGET